MRVIFLKEWFQDIKLRHIGWQDNVRHILRLHRLPGGFEAVLGPLMIAFTRRPDSRSIRRADARQ